MAAPRCASDRSRGAALKLGMGAFAEAVRPGHDPVTEAAAARQGRERGEAASDRRRLSTTWRATASREATARAVLEYIAREVASDPDGVVIEVDDYGSDTCACGSTSRPTTWVG